MPHPEAQTITLGGKERRVLFSVAAFRLAKLKHGSTVTLAEMQSMEVELVPRLIWIGLLADDPSLTEEDCMVMLAQDPDAEDAAIEALGQGMGALMDVMGKFYGTTGDGATADDVGAEGKAEGA